MLKLYVLVRKDLSFEQQAVQSSHAVAKFILNYPGSSWDNGTLVLLGVEDEDDLHYWADAIKDGGVDRAVFYEPDVSSDTSLAFVYDTTVVLPFKKRMDKKLRLLKMEHKNKTAA